MSNCSYDIRTGGRINNNSLSNESNANYWNRGSSNYLVVIVGLEIITVIGEEITNPLLRIYL